MSGNMTAFITNVTSYAASTLTNFTLVINPTVIPPVNGEMRIDFPIDFSVPVMSMMFQGGMNPPKFYCLANNSV